jgi:DNA-binding SARP family transcriptional activator
VRTLLTLLLLDAGRLITAERLIDGLYGQDPPGDAANALQSLVSRLRRGLGAAGPVEFHTTGYRLAVERESVDVHRFERLAGDGRRALSGGDHARADTLLGEALGLWRGPALADAPFARAQAARLEELRVAAAEDRAAAGLLLGRCRDLVAELRELVALHPLRERPRGQPMRAPQADGRQAEALAVYEDVRRALADELGADPSPDLAAVHLSILRGERPVIATAGLWARPEEAPAAHPTAPRRGSAGGGSAAARPAHELRRAGRGTHPDRRAAHVRTPGHAHRPRRFRQDAAGRRGGRERDGRGVLRRPDIDRRPGGGRGRRR